MCKDRVRKVKAKLELILTRGTKDDRKGFYRCVNQKKEGQRRFTSR